MSSMKIFTLLVVASLVLGACASDEPDPTAVDPSPASNADAPDDADATAGTSEGIEFDKGRAILQGEQGVTFVNVEVAETPEQQAQGLMHREHLDEDAGMAFIFFEETSGGFWMMNTLIPLSIAFFDAKGEIVRILDMDPCEEEPCEVYEPGVPYMGALEVNQGAFEEWNITEGDTIRLLHAERR